MSADRSERKRLLLAQIAVERAELGLAMGELRDSVTPAVIARTLTGGLWQAVVHRGAARSASTSPAAAVLLTTLRRYPLLASTLTALLPFVRRYVTKRLGFKRIFWGLAALGTGWVAYRATQR